uniref:DUF6598 domain-containing protein n=1 Tax=Leersia perrieri TaxID=77586 RepID=A0A0D9XW41_9ORYZ
MDVPSSCSLPLESKSGKKRRRTLDEEQEDNVLEKLKHRDGSIYRGVDYSSVYYRLADTNETRLEPMMLSPRTESCTANPTNSCLVHQGCSMLQIFSLKLSSIVAADFSISPVQVYGFMAIRDNIDHLRNYVFKRTRDDPFVVSRNNPFILLTGPKRGISMESGNALIEYDMRIKKDDNKEDDDLQLIDGAAILSELTLLPHIIKQATYAQIYMRRIAGNYGAVDMTVGRLVCAVEATIHVEVTEMRCSGGFNLSMACHLDRIPREFKLFEGAIVNPCELNKRKFVIALIKRSMLVLDFKAKTIGSPSEATIRVRQAIMTKLHGQSARAMVFPCVSMLVNVYWSTLPPYPMLI